MHMPNDYLSDVWSAIAVSSKMWTLIDPPFSRPTVNRLSICISVTKAIAGLQIRALLKLLGCLYNN